MLFAAVFLLFISVDVHSTRFSRENQASLSKSVTVDLDGVTIDEWKENFFWNLTRMLIVEHLNSFCQEDQRCRARFTMDNIHLIDVNDNESTSIELRVAVDQPSIDDNRTSLYNYTALLTAALFQAKIDFEHFYDNQRPSISVEHHSSSTFVIVLTATVLLVLLVVFLILFVYKCRHHQYTKLFQQPMMLFVDE